MLGTLRTMWLIFLHAFRRRATVAYPDAPVRLAPRFRGRIILSRDPDGEERCVACYLCAVACPVDCISLQKTEDGHGRWYPEFFRINFSRCIFCGYCEEACPTYAIQLTPDFEMSEYHRPNLVYEKEDLLIDGTGYSPAPPPLGALDSAVPSSGLSVVAQIELFKQVTGFSGNVHRPRYLMLVWGKLVATCVLESFSVAYKLFTPEGLPLRAVISATFKEHKDSVQGELEKNLSSPDIQHAHVVRSGEHLTNVVQSVYKMPDHYISIAEANGLHTVRQVAAGSTLLLPPLR